MERILVIGGARGAVEYATRHLAADLAPVRVSVVSPGVVHSGARDRLGDKGRLVEQERGRDLRRRYFISL